MSRRTAHTLSAGAMADIGFLLLTFFFLVTTITEERGILVTLPEWNAPAATVSEENVFHIHVNGRNEIMADGHQVLLEDIGGLVQEFVLNPGRDASLPSSPRHAVVSLHTDRQTSYEIYLQIYDMLKSTYRQMWDAEAESKYGLAYQSLSDRQKTAVRNTIPFVVSEADPTDF